MTAATDLGVRFNATSTGTGDFVDASAVQGYRRGAGNLVDGNTFRYRAESADLTQFEWGTGVWSASGSTLTRATIKYSSTGAKVSFSTVPQVAVIIFPEDMREVLQAARTYYVLSTGSDSNNGLANTAGGAFLTIQKAIDTVANLDINTRAVTIQVGSGTYAGVVVIGHWLGSGVVTLTGDTTTPGNCIINNGAGDCVYVLNGGTLNIQGFKLTASAWGLNSYATASIYVTGKMEYGACGGHMRAALSASVTTDGTSYTISGGASFHILCSTCGLVSTQSCTVTLTGTPAFGAVFVLSLGTCSVFCDSTTYTGAATGARYSAQDVAFISTGGGGANYFPGNAAGATATGAVYT